MDSETLGLLLGSSVLAAAIGAYLQSGRQREERFRERMIEAALAFLEEATKAENLLLGVVNARRRGETGDADDPKILDAINEASFSVPLLRIVFPDQQVANAANDLIAAIDDLRKSLTALDDDLPPDAELRGMYGRITDTRDAYTSVTQRSIRRSAFRRAVFGRDGV